MKEQLFHKKKSWPGALVGILIAELAGGLAALLSGDIPGYYRSLALPPLAPPAWVFPVAWGILYALMGLASWRIYRSRREGSTSRRVKSGALYLYGLQLILNVLWCLVFFRWRILPASVALILALLLVVLLCLWTFLRVDRKAGLLLVPYLLWLCYASYLNIGIWLLN